MEFDELFVPPEAENDYAAGVLTDLFGQIIMRLHGNNADSDVITTNWMETVFTVFNALCLLGMLIVLSYTIYTMIFDTAADGKTFGNTADAKYTILRSLGGVIAFVPVSGGYSLVQVAFFWVLLQGSAFADVTWRTIATNMLDGTPMVASDLDKASPNSQARLQEFGTIFDTLVTGHICGINGNLIQGMLAGGTDLSAADATTIGGSGPIQQRLSGLELENNSTFLKSIQGKHVVGMSQMLSFEDTTSSYSGRTNYCGAVRLMDSYTASVNDDGDFSAGLLAARSQQQFAHLAGDDDATSSVLATLSEEAHDVAARIVDGERDSEALLNTSQAAVYAALNSYLGGPAISTSINSAVVEDAHEELMNMVTEQGWMLAPVWQRGVANTVSAIELPGDTLRIEPVRENRLTDFLGGRGYRTNRADGAISDMLAQADSDQDAWDELASAVRNLPPPGSGEPVYGRIGDPSGGGVDNFIMNYLYSAVFEFFSPVAAKEGEGNYGFVDPMIQVQKQGTVLASAGVGALSLGTVAGVGSSSLPGKVAGFISGLGEVADTISGALVSFGVTLMVVGMIMIVILPLIPTIFFYVGALTWIWQAIDTLFALPLTFLRLFAPSRDAVLLGDDISRAVLAVFAVFIRPFFMVVGLILSMMVIGIALSYLHEIFGILMFFGASTEVVDTGIPGVGMAEAMINGGWGLVKLIFLMALYVIVAFITVLYGSQMIVEFGEFALNLMGAAVSRYTMPNKIADKAVLTGGMGYAGAASMARLPGSATSAVSKAGRARLASDDGGGGASRNIGQA